MVRQRYGRIINIGSVVGLRGQAGTGVTTPRPGGLDRITKACARELAPRNITVNLVVPGLIATDMTAIMSDALREEALKRIPLGRAGTAEDVAHMVSFLASERAGYITGSVILVDGGLGM